MFYQPTILEPFQNNIIFYSSYGGPFINDNSGIAINSQNPSLILFQIQ
jgi:hypothetical protein